MLTKSDREIYLAYRNPERRHSGPLCSAFQEILFQKWMSFIVAIAWTLAMRDTVNKSSFRRKHLEHLLTFEQKWSRLARELNDQYRHHEVTVEIVRDYVVKRGHCGIIGLLAHVRTVLGCRV